MRQLSKAMQDERKTMAVCSYAAIASLSMVVFLFSQRSEVMDRHNFPQMALVMVMLFATFLLTTFVFVIIFAIFYNLWNMIIKKDSTENTSSYTRPRR
jgi:hypothetical protein